MRISVKPIILLLCIVATSCSLKKSATTMTAKIITDGMRAVESETDLWIAKQSIIPMVKILEVLKAGDPENVQFSGLMSKVYGNIAFGFFEPKYLTASKSEKGVWLRRIEQYYRLGYENGLISLKGRLGKGIGGSVMDFEKAIEKAKEKDLMVLFWTAFDLGNLVNLNRDDVTSIANLPKVNAMIDRVLALDPDFGYGTALAFKAAMLASRPKMLGGNPEEARKLFEKAIHLNDGKYLMTRVMYAEWYAIPKRDTKLTRRLLGEVLDADPQALPEQALANQLAKERARILLKR